MDPGLHVQEGEFSSFFAIPYTMIVVDMLKNHDIGSSATAAMK